MEVSDVQFAKSGDVHIAYQRWGTGPDVVIVPPLVSNVELGWEQDIHAVMDAEGIERASLLGLSEGGVMAQYFAARHPERVDRLVLANSSFGLSAVEQARTYARPGETVPGVTRSSRACRTWSRRGVAIPRRWSTCSHRATTATRRSSDGGRATSV